MRDDELADVATNVAAFLEWTGGTVLVSRASLGLEAVLRAWRGTERLHVALSPIVCQDVVAAILAADCVPHFVDVDPETGEVLPCGWVEAREAGCTVAIIVHLYGRLADVAAATCVFSSTDCLVIDDAAQAFGTTGAKGFAGTLADVGLVSFGATKQISSGGAAVLVRSPQLLHDLRYVLDTISYVEAARAHIAEKSFRLAFDRARDVLVDRGQAAAPFVGLLDGYEDAIRVEVDPDVMRGLPSELHVFPHASAQRVLKARRWQEGLIGSRFVEVPFVAGEVPWRYVCRLPGSTWAEQRSLGDAIRAAGISTSNWYLPAHWYLAEGASLAGAEQFASEVFQFWVDDSLDVDAVGRASDRVRDLVGA
jgi:hypothetical protein